jgi:TolA-binding protein
MIVFAVVAALLLSGCSFARRRSASPGEASAKATRAELAALRQENEVLKRTQAETLKKMGALQKSLQAERAEQRRFREMMATNFDLLEQSVALSLSKTMGKQLVVRPNELKLPAPAEKDGSPNSATGHPRALPPEASQPQGHAAEGNPRLKAPSGTNDSANRSLDANTPMKGASGDASTTAARPVVMQADDDAGDQGARGVNGEDPDLTPPANPRNLTSHREAKALYDKGFSHFAHKQYGRAVLVYRDFLARFPEDIYSDNAQFWIGEAYLRQNRFSEAEAAYRKVLRDYAHRSSLEGYKTPESIYRIGQTYLKRDDPQRAKYYFTAAAERFPDTSAGRKAQRELASLALKTAGTGKTLSRAPGS